MATQTIDKLNDLIKLDIDAVEAYEQALKKIEENDIHAKIKEFQQDHERHINNLSEAVRSLNGQPPERKQDWKGFLIEGFTALRSITGTEGALKAMQSNEELTNKKYKEALDINAEERIKMIIRQNYADEQRHLQYIKTKLQEF